MTVILYGHLEHFRVTPAFSPLRKSPSGRSASDRVDEAAHLVGILFAGAALDAAGDVNGVRADKANRVGDVVRREASREDERYARLEIGEQLPRDDLAGATVAAGDMGIDEDGRWNSAGGQGFFEIGRDCKQTSPILHRKRRN